MLDALREKRPIRSGSFAAEYIVLGPLALRGYEAHRHFAYAMEKGRREVILGIARGARERPSAKFRKGPRAEVLGAWRPSDRPAAGSRGLALGSGRDFLRE